MQGDSATVRVVARIDGDERPRELELVRERGGWRIDSLG